MSSQAFKGSPKLRLRPILERTGQYADLDLDLSPLFERVFISYKKIVIVLHTLYMVRNVHYKLLANLFRLFKSKHEHI